MFPRAGWIGVRRCRYAAPMPTTIEALRTPDEHFRNLPGYAWAPHYLDALPGFANLRMHYLDSGADAAAEVFLCLHGEPTWAYLYRKMVPVFAATGARVLAPDLFGFGRSDKPVDEALYTFGFHRRALLAFIDCLGLDNLTLVCQDWGGILGLTLPLELGKRVRRLLVMNTDLPAGTSPGPGFIAWRDYVRARTELSCSRLLMRSDPVVSSAEGAAYDAPFPDARYQAGVRRFPEPVPIEPDMEGAALCRDARAWLRTDWRGSCFMAVGAQDPVLGPAVMERLRADIRGASPLLRVADAGHFVQERGAAIATAALAWFAGGG